MLGIKHLGQFALDLWQGDADQFYCDGLKLSFTNFSESNSSWMVVEDFEKERLIALIQDSLRLGKRHLAINVADMEPKKIYRQILNAIKEIALSEVVDAPCRFRVSFLVPFSGLHKEYFAELMTFDQ